MHHVIIGHVLLAASLLLVTYPSTAGEQDPANAGSATVIKKATIKSDPQTAKKQPAKAKVALVDINSAPKKELRTLPDIGDAEADQIIAGRPYGSKSHLTTRGILPREVYERLKMRVIAGQSTVAVPQANRN